MLRSLALSIAVLIVSNLVPLAGVLFWNWDLFLLMMLYWSETATIGFWMAASAVRHPPDGMHRASVGVAVAFFAMHAGGFMAGHLLFLWVFFAGKWQDRIHGLGDFVREIVVGSGLWLPVLVMFIARGLTAWLDRPFELSAGAPRQDGPSLLRFYARIALMHVTILAGGILMQNYGPHAPLFLLVGLKLALDLIVEFTAYRTPTPAKPRAAAPDGR
jgi:hypothetical protein